MCDDTDGDLPPEYGSTIWATNGTIKTSDDPTLGAQLEQQALNRELSRQCDAHTGYLGSLFSAVAKAAREKQPPYDPNTGIRLESRGQWTVDPNRCAVSGALLPDAQPWVPDLQRDVVPMTRFVEEQDKVAALQKELAELRKRVSEREASVFRALRNRT